VGPVQQQLAALPGAVGWATTGGMIVASTGHFTASALTPAGAPFTVTATCQTKSGHLGDHRGDRPLRRSITMLPTATAVGDTAFTLATDATDRCAAAQLSTSLGRSRPPRRPE